MESTYIKVKNPGLFFKHIKPMQINCMSPYIDLKEPIMILDQLAIDPPCEISFHNCVCFVGNPCLSKGRNAGRGKVVYSWISPDPM